MSSQPGWYRPWLRRLGYGLIGAIAVYLLGANLVLNTPLLRLLINRKPEKLLVEWRSGWTIVPGVVHIRDLAIRGQSRTIQWQCRLRNGKFRIALWALPAKVVKIRKGRGERFAFHFRERVETPEQWAEIASVAPEIDGLTNPPERAPEDLYPPPADQPNPWHLDISDILFTDAVDLWLARIRIEGPGRIGGGLNFELRTQLEVPDGFLELADARITIGGDVLAAEFPLEVRHAGLAPFLPHGTKPMEVLRLFRGDVRIDGARIDDLSVLQPLLPADGAVKLIGGRGRIDVDMAVGDDGHGDVGVALDAAELVVDDRRWVGDVQGELQVENGDTAGRYEIASAHVRLKNVVGGDEAEHEAPWRGRIDIDDGSVVLRRPVELDMSLRFELQDSRPVLAAFLSKRKDEDKRAPAWVWIVPTIEDLAGSARLAHRQPEWSIDDFELHGDDVDMLARLRRRDQQTTGQLYVRYRALHLGVDLRPDGKDLKLSKPRQWFRESTGRETGRGDVDRP